MKPRYLLFSVLLMSALTSCSVYENQRLTRTELYFGLSRPDGSLISGKDWQAFADTVIAPTFSLGSTIVDGSGQWLGNKGQLISEPSKVLIVFLKMNKTNSRKIEQVRQKYKTYYQQEAVMRVDKKMRVGF